MRSGLYPVQALRRRVFSWAVKLRVNPRVVRVQAMRHKWGSCSPGGTVTLAVALVDEAVRFQDYVIVHELLHLRLAGHGRVFKALLTAHVPGWQVLRPRSMPSLGNLERSGTNRARERACTRNGRDACHADGPP